MKIILIDTNKRWTVNHPLLAPYKEDIILLCTSSQSLDTHHDSYLIPEELINVTKQPQHFNASSRLWYKIMNNHNDWTFTEHDVLYFLEHDSLSLLPLHLFYDHHYNSRIHLFFDEALCNDSQALTTFFSLEKVMSIAFIHSKWTNMTIQNAIDDIRYRLNRRFQYFFDTRSNHYVEIQKAYNNSHQSSSIKENQKDLSIYVEILRCGQAPNKFDPFDQVKLYPKFIFSHQPQINGKEICQILKQIRLNVAKLYHIPYQNQDCDYNGYCSGSCEQCEKELDYLNHELIKIKNQNITHHQINNNQSSVYAKIYCISPLRYHTDGEGITSLITLSGCNLGCQYCQNHKCQLPSSSNLQINANDFIKLLMPYSMYYLYTKGGLTFSGGEPLLQANFIYEVCKIKPQHWKINIQTALNLPLNKFKIIIPYVDKWYIDIKDIHNDIYEKYTGWNNQQVLNNIDYLMKHIPHSQIHFRIPLIPNFNNDDNRLDSLSYLTTLYGNNFTYELFEYSLLY